MGQVNSAKFTVSGSTVRDHLGSGGGRVYFVGSGCGDPELLTLKAHRVLQSAEVILYDALVNDALFQYFPKQTEAIYVGKRCAQHSLSQAEIGNLILKKAKEGKTVLRLKGGDPSVFARLAEETELLSEHGIPFAIIPGVTAASGCAAYSGIPLTHRDCAQSLTFVTAQRKQDGSPVDWKALAQQRGTLVFYMGLSKVTEIAEQLIRAGMPKETAMAIVDNGSLAQQKVICSTLGGMESDMQHQELLGPAVILVGEVVNKRQQVSLSMLAEDYQRSSQVLSLAL
ncbi:uroporphyrinogen-III C-methyltransferase [uncultured Pseudoteredinibacter sp.]|uniref:uroporphyrinogen-III C-methyltransferase n=1 Tax=uncultured Pseudoteredinibacter sp. TaxID=1641701 RepID=UPI00260C2654|nr:uroporphyrinogen-III C-methyltransferase [uncultured Pseudoteredinibacter sp.]